MLGTVALAGLVAAAVVTVLESGIDTDEGPRSSWSAPTSIR